MLSPSRTLARPPLNAMFAAAIEAQLKKIWMK